MGLATNPHGCTPAAPVRTGGPLQPGFGLSGAVTRLDRVFQQNQYRRRSRVIEFCHAWIKSKLGLRQFHLRGLAKVQMEMLWAGLTYNLQQWIRLRKLQAPPAVA
jgi:Transposase DDE domain